VNAQYPDIFIGWLDRNYAAIVQCSCAHAKGFEAHGHFDQRFGHRVDDKFIPGVSRRIDFLMQVAGKLPQIGPAFNQNRMPQHGNITGEMLRFQCWVNVGTQVFNRECAHGHMLTRVELAVEGDQQRGIEDAVQRQAFFAGPLDKRLRQVFG